MFCDTPENFLQTPVTPKMAIKQLARVVLEIFHFLQSKFNHFFVMPLTASKSTLTQRPPVKKS